VTGRDYKILNYVLVCMIGTLPLCKSKYFP